ncbi:substrate-binding domain-containing protein, partial [Klebsiella pneumoniae]|uniref:substrate-binding domain-containing protein n=1 Tax=Klebsiella pneumoniae TaxID=573 RepID=UPI003F5425F0
TQNSRHRYAASTSGNPSFSVLRQGQYRCELTQVPNTVAIASLGGGVLSTVCSPALTTVEFPWHDIGVKAGKALLELLNDKPGEKFIEIPSVLKVRASTAA